MADTDCILNDSDEELLDADPPLAASLKRKASVYHQEPNVGSATFAISVFNMMNAVLGSGILAMPYAMAQLGIVLFYVFEVVIYFLALYSVHLLLIMCEKTNVKAYEKLGYIAFGLPGRIVAAICIVGQNIGAMSTYLFIVKYELPNIIMTFMGTASSDGSWYYDGNILVVIATCFVILPLACSTEIGFLGYTSGFSMFCMLFFMAVVVAKKFLITCPLFEPTLFVNTSFESSGDDLFALHNSSTHATEAYVSEDFTTVMPLVDNATDAGNASVVSDLELLQERARHVFEASGEQMCQADAFRLTSKWPYSVPTMIFSFSGHVGVLPIYAELKKPSVSRMQNVANTAFTGCFILYSMSALFGYLTFYNWLEPELLLTYNLVDTGDTLMLAVRLCIVAAVIVTVPVNHFSARKAMTFILFPNKDFSWKAHIGIMLGMLAFINVLVIYVPTIREVFGIVGATACTMVTFILPCVFFLKIDDSAMKSPKRIFVFCFCVLGIAVMLQSLVVIIYGYFS